MLCQKRQTGFSRCLDTLYLVSMLTTGMFMLGEVQGISSSDCQSCEIIEVSFYAGAKLHFGGNLRVRETPHKS